MIFDDDRDLVRFLPGRWQAAGVSRRTWRRWMDGSSRIPFAVVYLARLLVAGELPHGGEAWRGWTLKRTGELVDPEGVTHTPATIVTWHWMAGELSALRAEENQRGKIQRLRTGRDGQALTRELHRRLTEARVCLPRATSDISGR